MARFGPTGELLAVHSAADNAFAGAILRSYGMKVLYRVAGLEGASPSVTLALNWPDAWGCSVPATVGDFHVLPVMFAEAVVVLDLSDPASPREVSRVSTPGYTPHRAAADPSAPRVVVTSYGPSPSLEKLVFNVDPTSGTLTLDPAFGSTTLSSCGGEVRVWETVP